MNPRLSQEAYDLVCERLLQAMFWQGILVPAGLAERHAAELVAMIELDLARQACANRTQHPSAA
jgi:hypothetical protein